MNGVPAQSLWATEAFHVNLPDILFPPLDGCDLFEVSKVCKVWRRRLLAYAPGRLLQDHPEEYREGITGRAALNCLFSHSITSRNLARGQFRHTVFHAPWAEGGNGFFPGISKDRLGMDVHFVNQHSKRHESGMLFISARSGAIERVFKRKTVCEWFVDGLFWHKVENAIQAWDPITGSLKHTMTIRAGEKVGKVKSLGCGRVEVYTYITDQVTWQAISDPKRTRLMYLRPPHPDCTLVRMGSRNADACLRGANAVSVVWQRQQGNILALYSLESEQSELLPIEESPWLFAERVRARNEVGNCHFVLVRTDEQNYIYRWRLVDAAGNSLIDKQIVQHACSNTQIILLVDEGEHYSFEAYDPATLQCAWSCPIPHTLPTLKYCPIMKLVSSDRLFVYSDGVYLLLDLCSHQIVKYYQCHRLQHGFEHFDGEKIVDCTSLKLFHVLDFTYRHEAPVQMKNICPAKDLLVGTEPDVAEQSYALQPSEPIELLQEDTNTVEARPHQWKRIFLIAGIAVAAFVAYSGARRLLRRDDAELASQLSSLRL